MKNEHKFGHNSFRNFCVTTMCKWGNEIFKVFCEDRM